jgi:hypothetical protein
VQPVRTVPSHGIRQIGTKVSVVFSPSISRVESATLHLDQRACCHVANCVTSSMTIKFLSGIKWNEDEFDVRGHGRLLWVCPPRVRNAQRSSGNWLLTVRSSQPQGHKDLAPQDLFLKSGFKLGCAKIWLTSHIKQETKQDGVTLTSFRKASGSNLRRGTNYPH